MRIKNLKKRKTKLNWALITEISSAKTSFKRFKIQLSFSNIKSLKKLGSIITFLFFVYIR